MLLDMKAVCVSKRHLSSEVAHLPRDRSVVRGCCYACGGCAHSHSRTLLAHGSGLAIDYCESQFAIYAQELITTVWVHLHFVGRRCDPRSYADESMLYPAGSAAFSPQLQFLYLCPDATCLPIDP